VIAFALLVSSWELAPPLATAIAAIAGFGIVMYGVHLGWLLFYDASPTDRPPDSQIHPPECALFRVWPPLKAGKVRSGFERQISIQAIQSRRCSASDHKRSRQWAAGKGQWCSPTAPTQMHSTEGVSSEHPCFGHGLDRGQQRRQLLNAGPQLVNVVLHRQNSANAFQIDALVLAQPLDQAKPGDIARRVAPTPLGGSAR